MLPPNPPFRRREETPSIPRNRSRTYPILRTHLCEERVHERFIHHCCGSGVVLAVWRVHVRGCMCARRGVGCWRHGGDIEEMMLMLVLLVARCGDVALQLLALVLVSDKW